MYLRVLGTAAGGGFPQWNCTCPLCRRVRSEVAGVRPRSHACLALSVTGKNWYLVNAAPDVHYQTESFSALHPGPGLRQTPVRGILLTDAELDHTLGLLVLREGTPLDVYATPAVLAALAQPFPVQSILKSYAPIQWVEIKPNNAFLLDESRLRVQGFCLGTKRPRYAVGSKIDGDWVIGYRFEDLGTGGVAVYAPAVEAWSKDLDAQLALSHCVFMDGTFWADDEMIQIGAGKKTAREMGHLPITGADGSAEHLSNLAAGRKIYVHMNNTNPVLNEDSTERRFLADRGIDVGWDGMELEV